MYKNFEYELEIYKNFENYESIFEFFCNFEFFSVMHELGYGNTTTTKISRYFCRVFF